MDIQIRMRIALAIQIRKFADLDLYNLDILRIVSQSTRSRPVRSDDKENQSDASSDLTQIFSDNRSDSDSTSDPEVDSEDSNDEDEPGDDISDDEGQLPCEHYLAQAQILDVSQL